MKLIQTDIADSNLITESNNSKIICDFLIENVVPLFYEEIRKKQKQYSMKMAELKQLNEGVINKKNDLLKIQTAIDKETLKTEVLKIIESTNSVNITEKNKATIQMMLRTIDKKSAGVLKEWITFLQKKVTTKKEVK